MDPTDNDIEARLRRYRPAGPPARLRDRCLAVPPQPRMWPWAVAAAALLMLAISLDSARAGMVRQAEIDMVPDPSTEAVSQLTAALGGGDPARVLAEQAVYEDVARGREASQAFDVERGRQ